MIINRDDSNRIDTEYLSHVGICNPVEKSTTMNVIEADRDLSVLSGKIEDTLEKDDMHFCRLQGCEDPDSNNR